VSHAQFQLSEDETQQVSALLQSLAPVTQRDEQAVIDLLFESHQLPLRLRRFVHDFLHRVGDATPCCILSGFPVDAERIGPTPSFWKRDDQTREERQLDNLVLLVSSLFGTPFTLTSEHDARYLVQNVFPIREHRHRQLSSNSDARIVLHTEDAFLPAPPDYLGLLCLRNPQQAPTELSFLDTSALDAETLAALREDVFLLEPDESNTLGACARPDEASGEPPGLCRLFVDPDLRTVRTPVLHGDARNPTLIYDPFFARPAMSDSAHQALRKLEEHLEQAVVKVVLAPGDFLWFDNRRIAHGRSPFAARFDGTDRWLKRIRVARDVRKLGLPRPFSLQAA
jgi:Fe(II)/alpha-ketoglutarate-dependent arginine beta-hydroxylase